MVKFSLDIDECDNSEHPVCSQMCNNTVGSYNCSCSSGFRLDDTDLRTCDGTIHSYQLETQSINLA